MGRSKKHQLILNTYPAIISKEQMYRICHISKETALHLLVNGLIPCTISEKKTRRYKIETKDVVKYLELREKYPEHFVAPANWYCKRSQAIKKIAKLKEMPIELRLDYYASRLEPYPDVLTTKEVSEIVGFSKSAVAIWCKHKLLFSFDFGSKYMVPKRSLLEFLVGEGYWGNPYDE